MTRKHWNDVDKGKTKLGAARLNEIMEMRNKFYKEYGISKNELKELTKQVRRSLVDKGFLPSEVTVMIEVEERLKSQKETNQKGEP